MLDKHEWTDGEGRRFFVTAEGIGAERPSLEEAPASLPDLGAEILRLAARVRKLEADEATNRYLWRKWVNSDDETGDSVAAALVHLHALEAENAALREGKWQPFQDLANENAALREQLAQPRSGYAWTGNKH